MTQTAKTYWAGFVDGNLYFAYDDDPITKEKLPDHACIYKTKKGAKVCFDDVRLVRLVEVKK